jgi:predicted DNA-binding mobile mystery protein A
MVQTQAIRDLHWIGLRCERKKNNRRSFDSPALRFELLRRTELTEVAQDDRTIEEEKRMRSKERSLARKKLDKELKYYRWAGREKKPTQGLLRAVRQALGIPAAEILKELNVGASGLFRLEQSELRGTISMRALDRVARAMGCKLVYAIVPQEGKTLEELTEQRLWEKVLGVR